MQWTGLNVTNPEQEKLKRGLPPDRPPKPRSGWRRLVDLHTKCGMGPRPALGRVLPTNSRDRCIAPNGSPQSTTILGPVAEQATRPKEVKRAAKAVTSNIKSHAWKSRAEKALTNYNIHGCANNMRNLQTKLTRTAACCIPSPSFRQSTRDAGSTVTNPTNKQGSAGSLSLSTHSHWPPLDLDLGRHAPPSDSGCRWQHGGCREESSLAGLLCPGTLLPPLRRLPSLVKRSGRPPLPPWRQWPRRGSLRRRGS